MSTVPEELYNQNVYAAPQCTWEEPQASAEPNGRGLLWLLFSFKGRTRRIEYWAVKIMAIAVYFATVVASTAMFAHRGDDAILAFLEIVTLSLFVWVSLATEIKRWHDRNKPGSWIFINIIPIVGPLWQFVELGILPGTPGENRFGPDPSTRRTA